MCEIQKKRALKARKGTTLVELLITIVVMTLIMGAVVTIFMSFYKNFQMHEELSTAQQHCEMGLSLMEPYVLNAGMGMPDGTANYREVFNVPAPPAFQSWEGPVSVIPPNQGVRVLAVRPVLPGIGIGSDREQAVGTAPTAVSVSLGGGGVTPPFNNALHRGDWIIFPSSKYPFLVAADPENNSNLTLQSVSPDSIHAFDTLALLKGVTFSVQNEKLSLSEGGIELSTVDGVSKMYADWDEAAQALYVVLLGKGTARQGRLLPAIPPGWPGAALTEEERHYRHVAVGRIWRVRN